MDRWKVLDSEKVLDSKWISVDKQKVRTSKGRIIDDFYVVKKIDYVILVVENENKISFVKQYRHGRKEIMFNLPMGFINEGESPEEAARRELLEETGQISENLELLGSFYLAPSFTPTKTYVFYTKSARKVGTTKTDINEDLTPIEISKEKVKEMINNNEIKDMSSLIAIYTANKKLRIFD